MGLVPPGAGIKKYEAYFLKEAKAAALQLRSPPGGEAKATNLNEKVNTANALLIMYLTITTMSLNYYFYITTNTNIHVYN